jgi:hypothetical protein
MAPLSDVGASVPGWLELRDERIDPWHVKNPPESYEKD